MRPASMMLIKSQQTTLDAPMKPAQHVIRQPELKNKPDISCFLENNTISGFSEAPISE